jgi:hypothetical protein
MHSLFEQGPILETDLTQSETTMQGLLESNKVGYALRTECKTVLRNIRNRRATGAMGWKSRLSKDRTVQSVSINTFEGQDSPLTFALTNHSTMAQRIAVMKWVNYTFTETRSEKSRYAPEGKFWTPAKAGQLGLVAQQAVWNSNNMRTGTVNQAPWDWNQFGLFQYDVPFQVLQYSTGPFTADGHESTDQLDWQTPVATDAHAPVLQAPSVFWVPVADAEK